MEASVVERTRETSRPEVSSTWKIIPEPARDRVTAVFDGYLDDEAGVESAAAFRAAFEGRSLEVCWDVRRMTGFAGAARTAWAEAIWPVRGQIKRLNVIGARGMIRVGATFLALLLGKPYKFLDGDEVEG
jgi:hypothetical protein